MERFLIMIYLWCNTCGVEVTMTYLAFPSSETPRLNNSNKHTHFAKCIYFALQSKGDLDTKTKIHLF